MEIRVEAARRDLFRLVKHRLEIKRQQSKEAASCLGSLSPLAVLSRGYSVTYRLPSRQVLRRAEEVRKGDPLEILLCEGRLECLVETVRDDDQRRKGTRGSEGA